MSSLLEQAIIDASALREAALKNAEQAIIEKYAPDIKEAVEKILEQDELLELEDEEEGDFPPEMALGDEEIEVDPYQIPDAAADGERLCPCPEEEQEIEIDFAKLAKATAELAPGDEEGEEELALQEMIEIDFNDLRNAIMESEKALGIGLLSEDWTNKEAASEETAEAAEEASEKSESLSLDEEDEEELELSEEMIDALLEKVTVDVDVNGLKSGWLERPVKEKEELEKLRLLALQDTGQREEFNKLNDTLNSLKESNARSEAKNKSLKGNMKKLIETVNILKEKFDEMAVINSRLLYTNRILKDASLNERQKDKVVDALSKCGTINEAKVIYETLQSAVSGRDKPAMPKSLREAIGRNSRSSTIIPTRRGTQTRELSFADRMKTLAGINDKN